MTTLLLLFFALIIELDTVNIPLNNDVKMTFAPAGKGEMRLEGSVTRVKVEVDQLRPPIPPLNTYVVWAVSPEGIFENLGELQVDRNKGAFQGTTRLNQLGLLITAEPHYMVDRPNFAAAYRSQNTTGETRRTTIQVEVGQYDYSNLKPAPPGIHPSVVQARTAFQLAQDAGAERIAESEFRQARVALGSMEELIMRAAPLDTLWPAANEAIRSAQRAVTAARDKAILTDLQNTKAEVETLNAEKQRLDARIRELTEERTQEQTAAAEQIRILRANAGTARSEKDEAESRAQSAERELAQLKQKEEELQGLLSLELRNDFYDENGLTEAGQEALLRIHNIAEVIPGPVRLVGNAPENAMKAAMEFLILAGTPQDRIMTRR